MQTLKRFIALVGVLTSTQFVRADIEGVPVVPRVYVIIGENTKLNQLTIHKLPYLMGTLAPQSAVLANYWALTHYSLPNYIGLHSGQWLVSQQLDGSPDSCLCDPHAHNPPCPCTQDVPNLFSQLQTAGLSFYSWTQSMPTPCDFIGTSLYGLDHNPQLYFVNVDGSICQTTNIPASSPANGTSMQAFLDAVNSNTVGAYNFIVPNECNNGENNCNSAPAGPLPAFDAFLQSIVPTIQADINARGGILIVLFDEGTGGGVYAENDHYGGNVMWLAWGPQVIPGIYSDYYQYGHYSHLRTVQDLLGLASQGYPYLGNATSVPPITGIWNV